MLSWETLHTIAAGGVAPHVTELAGALHAAGHQVHIFTRSSNGTTWEHPIWGVTYHEAPARWGRSSNPFRGAAIRAMTSEMISSM